MVARSKSKQANSNTSSVITRKWNYRVRFLLLPELLLFGLLVLLAMFLHESYGQPQNDDEDEKEESVEGSSKAEKEKEPEKDCTFVCPENRGNYADPCTCRRFYICSTDGAAHRSFCPNGLYWDDEKK